MAKVQIYGPAQSRAARALWICHELGIDFEHVPLEMKDLKTPQYLAINPNGKAPAMVDGDLKLFESMAINTYLAQKHNKNGFWPASLADQARASQWSFWGMTEIEKHLLTVLLDMFMTPADKKNPKAVEEATAAVQKPLKVLDEALKGRDYLLGSTFTLADLNVASIMSWAKLIKLDLSAYPNVAAWLNRCLGRDSFKAARGGK
jgi:glutathione S-transferase